ncbi:hypothetical protein HCN44_001832 [Aphidius gifuensis]|uniref:Bystin n=1 Tax=Aphidius gifuensis TaxID=684658 RepID=A0A835CX61_APHGI|nr:bystin [Aphidius gifuensis]KAF7996200.1 hypothetical protein HCN44_001832 [Aphidius gifuensis]
MGKAKKIKVSKSGMTKIALADQIEDGSTAKYKNRQKTKVRMDDDDEYIDADLSLKILSQARKQKQELEKDEEEEQVGKNVSKGAIKKTVTTKLDNSTMSDDEDNDNYDDDDDNNMPDANDHKYCEQIELDPEEERALEMFKPSVTKVTLSLGDMIKNAIDKKEAINNKISEKATDIVTQQSEAGDMNIVDLDPRVQAMYEGVGEVLTKYRSGKLPKAFKLIPNLRNWEQILYLTQPEKWSAAAMYQATRIFASNLKEKMAQRFYNLVLLPRIRDDLDEYKRLNFHLYQALKKSLFKPAAFMKGILLPLLESGNCTLREAVIIGSVVAKNSIPMLHSSAAMLKIAEMPYGGANSIFLRIFIDKKYALPYRAVDGVVHHFLQFERETRILPVLWHQAFLTFVQRYKSDISTEQKEALLELLKRQAHPTITPDIRRELQNAKCRDNEFMDSMNTE